MTTNDTTTTTTTATKITYRLTTCTCGCGGRDPWHARTFNRVVRNISADGREGWVNLPMSTRPVRVFRKTYGEWFPTQDLGEHADRLDQSWHVDRNSIEWDK